MSIMFDDEQKLRVWSIVTDLKHPITGEDCIAENYDAILKERAEISNFAWIIHDKDKRSQNDIKKYREKKDEFAPEDPIHDYYASAQVGDAIPPHLHIIIGCTYGVRRKEISEWFGVKPYLVKEVKGKRNKVENSLKYLLHIGSKNKFHYDASELHVSDGVMKALLKYQDEVGFDEKATLIEVAEKIRGGATVKQIRNEYPPYFFIKNIKFIQEAYMDYVLWDKPMPPRLVNVYFRGLSGTGKTTLATRVASALHPELDNPFFNTGTKGVTLQDYKGEPVILWGDTTPEKLMDVASGGDLYELLDPYNRIKVSRNIKHSRVILLQEVNLFTAVKGYQEFFEAIGDEEIQRNNRIYGLNKKDKQIYRRMQMVVELKDECISVMVNRSLLKDKKETTEEDVFYYDTVAKYRFPIAEFMGEFNKEIQEEVLAIVVKPIVEIINKLLDSEMEDYYKRHGLDGRARALHMIKIETPENTKYAESIMTAWQKEIENKQEQLESEYYDFMADNRDDDSDMRDAKYNLAYPGV